MLFAVVLLSCSVRHRAHAPVRSAEPVCGQVHTQSPRADPIAPIEPDAAEAPEPDETSAVPSTTDGTPCQPEETTAADVEPPPLPSGTTVLHIGDSFAGALGPALNRQLQRAGVRSILHYKTASYIPGWAASRDVPRYMARAKPDLVLVTLGANELSIQDPASRAKLVQRLASTIGRAPCVWIAPPLWRARHVSAALLTVIRTNCAPCRYMDTNALFPNMPRARDGIHPSLAAREEWARRVLDWLRAERSPSAEQPWALRPEPGGETETTTAVPSSPQTSP